MLDINQKSLEWLYKELKNKKVALSRAEEKYKGDCEDCVEIKNIKSKIEILDHLIELALKEA